MNYKELEELQYKEICNKINLPKVIDKNYLDLLYKSMSEDKRTEPPLEYTFGLSGQDVRNVDMHSLSLEDFKKISFDENTIFSFQQKLQFNPDKLLEEGKIFSEDIKDLHTAGIDGTGVKIAVIDKVTDFSNINLKNKILFFKKFCTKYNPFIAHGLTVTSLIADEQCGVAPNVSLYLFSTNFFKDEKEDIFKYIIKNNMKFDLISMSSFINKDPSIEELKKQLLASDNQILDSFKFFENFAYGRKNNNITLDETLQNVYNNRKNETEYIRKTIETIPTNVIISCAGRTHLQINGGYMYEGNNSASYSIPQVTGSYALAKQLRNNLSYDEFVRIAKETANKTPEGFYNINLKGIIRKIEKINCENKDRDIENFEIYNNSKKYFLRLDNIEKNKKVKNSKFSTISKENSLKSNIIEKDNDNLIL